VPVRLSVPSFFSDINAVRRGQRTFLPFRPTHSLTDRGQTGHVGSPHDDRKSDEVGDLEEVGDGGRLIVDKVGVGDVEDDVRSGLEDLLTQTVQHLQRSTIEVEYSYNNNYN